jgi:hypothetical protein
MIWLVSDNVCCALTLLLRCCISRCSITCPVCLLLPPCSHHAPPDVTKEEAFAILHANLSKLQEATGKFSRHLDRVRSVTDASQQLSRTLCRESLFHPQCAKQT